MADGHSEDSFVMEDIAYEVTFNTFLFRPGLDADVQAISTACLLPLRAYRLPTWSCCGHDLANLLLGNRRTTTLKRMCRLP